MQNQLVNRAFEGLSRGGRGSGRGRGRGGRGRGRGWGGYRWDDLESLFKADKGWAFCFHLRVNAKVDVYLCALPQRVQIDQGTQQQNAYRKSKRGCMRNVGKSAFFLFIYHLIVFFATLTVVSPVLAVWWNVVKICASFIFIYNLIVFFAPLNVVLPVLAVWRTEQLDIIVLYIFCLILPVF